MDNQYSTKFKPYYVFFFNLVKYLSDLKIAKLKGQRLFQIIFLRKKQRGSIFFYTNLHIYNMFENLSQLSQSAQRCQNYIFELTHFCSPSTGFELTQLIHCSTNRFALCAVPQTTRQHPLYKKKYQLQQSKCYLVS